MCHDDLRDVRDIASARSTQNVLTCFASEVKIKTGREGSSSAGFSISSLLRGSTRSSGVFLVSLPTPSRPALHYSLSPSSPPVRSGVFSSRDWLGGERPEQAKPFKFKRTIPKSIGTIEVSHQQLPLGRIARSSTDRCHSKTSKLKNMDDHQNGQSIPHGPGLMQYGNEVNSYKKDKKIP